MNLGTATVRRLFVVVLAVLALAAVACGGADAGGGADADAGADAASPTPVITPGQGPGVITISSTPISGHSGKILLVFASSAGGGGQLARLCVPITSNDFTLSGAVMSDVPAGDNPCAGETPETTFEEGAYELVAGIYVGGQRTPDAETTLTGQVAGDTTVEIDGSDLSS